MRSTRPLASLLAVLVLVATCPTAVRAQNVDRDKRLREVTEGSIALLERYLAAIDRSEFELDALAKTLGKDVSEIYTFVSCGIRNQAYAGALRGAAGCLRSGAGNSVDKSMLLRSLLDRAGYSTRLVVGEAGDELLDDIYGCTQVADPYRGDLDFPYSIESATIQAERTRALHEMERRLDTRLGVLRKILGPIEEGLSGAVENEATGRPWRADARRHVWVQVERDGKWMDLDPSCLWGETGEVYGGEGRAVQALPDELWHTVTLRGIEECFEGGKSLPREIFLWRTRACDLAGRALVLSWRKGSAGGAAALGGALGGAPGGGEASRLVLRLDGEQVATGALDFHRSGASGGGLGLGGLGGLAGGSGGGASGPSTVAVGIEAILEGPGREPLTARRYLVDRWGFAARAMGDLEALKRLRSDDGAADALEHTALCFACEPGSINPAELQARTLTAALESWRALAVQNGRLHIAGRLPGDASARLLGDAYYHLYDRTWERLSPVERYATSPRLVMVRLRRSAGRVRMDFDVTHEALRYRPRQPEVAPARWRFMAGLLSAIAEEEITTDPLASLPRPAYGAARALEALGVGTTARGFSAGAELPKALPAALRGYLSSAATGGKTIVLPGELPAGDSLGWFELDSESGDLRAWMADGLHSGTEYGSITGGKGEEDTAEASGLGNAARGIYRCAAQHLDTVLEAVATGSIDPLDAALGAAECVANAKDANVKRKLERQARRELEKRIKRAEREFRRNDDFRRWFHREFKPGQVVSGGGRHNPDLKPEQLADALDLWERLGRPFVK
ncbi:MAG: hypothetical protein HYZ53_04765 [Planctomycetes bacterium]|nr:hypothetical protein [Planctomycetota bacterium]